LNILRVWLENDSRPKNYVFGGGVGLTA